MLSTMALQHSILAVSILLLIFEISNTLQIPVATHQGLSDVPTKRTSNFVMSYPDFEILARTKGNSFFHALKVIVAVLNPVMFALTTGSDRTCLFTALAIRSHSRKYLRIALPCGVPDI
jgi:hypothetical protein